MQSWLDKVRAIRLRQNNKKLSILDLMNWFFTIGSTSEVIFKDENISDLYDEFLIDIVKYDFNVKEAIANLFKL